MWQGSHLTDHHHPVQREKVHEGKEEADLQEGIREADQDLLEGIQEAGPDLLDDATEEEADLEIKTTDGAAGVHVREIVVE